MGPRKPVAGGKPFADSAAEADDAGNLQQIYLQALLLAVTSALRGWARSAEVLARRAATISEDLQALQREDAARPDAPAVLLDELRAGLRELVEVPAMEARQFQADLQLLLERMQRPNPKATASPHRRRGKVKP